MNIYKYLLLTIVLSSPIFADGNKTGSVDISSDLAWLASVSIQEIDGVEENFDEINFVGEYDSGSDLYKIAADYAEMYIDISFTNSTELTLLSANDLAATLTSNEFTLTFTDDDDGVQTLVTTLSLTDLSSDINEDVSLTDGVATIGTKTDSLTVVENQIASGDGQSLAIKMDYNSAENFFSKGAGTYSGHLFIKIADGS
jgi:hypothetical protein